MNIELANPSKENENNLQTENQYLNKEDLPKDDCDIPDKKFNQNLLYEQKNISMFKLYCHLSNTTEVLLMLIGAVGGLASGVAGPLMSFLFGDSLGDFSDFQNGEVNIAAMEETVNDMVRRFLYIGVGMFIAEFLNNCFWSLAGLRQIYHMKEKYFALILKQEQGWFDSNNAYEFATKVQAQLEQIEMGLGEKFGLILQMTSQLISGLVIAFTSSWKLTLVMLCVAPFLGVGMLYMLTSMKRAIVLSRKTYEYAGGIAEELLYNIKTVASFANFNFETKRFNHYILIFY